MPRKPRLAPGGWCFHVINRGVNRAKVFHKRSDYAAFMALLDDACARVPMRVMAYCLMPNHFHMAVWPLHDGDMGRWMAWLLTTHATRYNAHYKRSGHVWQGRYKSFPVQQDGSLVQVCKYIERNPIRAGLVERADDWRWSSAKHWKGPDSVSVAEKGSDPFLKPAPGAPGWLTSGPVARPADWLRWVHGDQPEDLLRRLRLAIERGRPFGATEWVMDAAKRLGLESALRDFGRPRKGV